MFHSFKKKWNRSRCHNMDEPSRHFTNLNKQRRKRTSIVRSMKFPLYETPRIAEFIEMEK